MEVCPRCNGEQVTPAADDSGDDFLDEECPRCEGSGWVDDLEEIDDADID
jgi:DnaJ-class molecular chaperone